MRVFNNTFLRGYRWEGILMNEKLNDTLQNYADRNNGRLPVDAIKEDLKVGIYFDFSTMKIEVQKDV